MNVNYPILPEITLGQCKRVVMRIMQFSQIRAKILASHDLKKILARYAPTDKTLPSWCATATL